MTNPMNVAVLGAGSWGTALALLVREQGHALTLWGRDRAALAEIAEARENRRYLPGHVLPPDVRVTSDLTEATARADAIVLALPSAQVGAVARAVGGAFAGVALCASKGFDPGSHRTLDLVLSEAWPRAAVALLSGPTFAVEIARGLPAAAVVASRDARALAVGQAVASSERFRLYTTDDVAGVAVGGALKNVVAIAAGCADGLQFGSNARAALITRGLHEMGRLARRLGGDALTLAGLAGLGDLVLTCTGDLSRNRTVGMALGRGEELPTVLARLGHVAEGVETAQTAAALARELDVEMPIACRVAEVLAGEKTAREAVAELLAREVRPERD